MRLCAEAGEMCAVLRWGGLAHTLLAHTALLNSAHGHSPRRQVNSATQKSPRTIHAPSASRTRPSPGKTQYPVKAKTTPPPFFSAIPLPPSTLTPFFIYGKYHTH